MSDEGKMYIRWDIFDKSIDGFVMPDGLNQSPYPVTPRLFGLYGETLDFISHYDGILISVSLLSRLGIDYTKDLKSDAKRRL